MHLDLVEIQWTRARCTNTKFVLCFADTESRHTSLHNETRNSFVTLENTIFTRTLLRNLVEKIAMEKYFVFCN